MAFAVAKTLEQWAAQASKTHENKFTYKELFTYKNKPWLVAVCLKHGDFKIDASSHATMGKGCRLCGVESRSASATLTFEEFVLKAQQVHGNKYTYVSMTKGKRGEASVVTAICPTHGEFTQLRTHHLNGHGCSLCAFEKNADRCRHSVVDWLSKFRLTHGEAYTYPKTFPLGSESRIDIVCAEHGVFNQSLIRHSTGDGCPTCGHDKTGLGLQSNFYGAVSRAQQIHEDKYLYLGIYRTEDKGLGIQYLCKAHGYQEQTLKTHCRGHGCNSCAFESRAENRRYKFEDLIIDFTEVHGDTYRYKELIPSNAGVLAKIVAICSKHGEFTQDVSGHLGGYGCPSCGTLISKPNREIFSYLQSLGLSPVLEYRIDLLEGRKIFADIYVPEVSLIIEHMGLKWHSSEFKPKTFLADRQKAVEKAGHSFLGVYGDEWAYQQPAVKSLLASRCGKLQSKVFARNCSLSEIPRNQAKAFIDDHHVQGYNSYGAKYLALSLGGEVVAVAVITNQTSNRFASSNLEDWELVRFCSSAQVIGGASKLLSYFRRLVPSAKRIISFSDIRLFSGNLYEKLGFTLDEVLPPDYSYVIGRRRKHKRGFQKSDLIAMFPGSDPNLTEQVLTETNGIYRVYDSGKIRWVKFLN